MAFQEERCGDVCVCFMAVSPVPLAASLGTRSSEETMMAGVVSDRGNLCRGGGSSIEKRRA